MADAVERETTPLIVWTDAIEDIDEAIEYATRSGAKFQWIVFIAGGIMFMSDSMEITLLAFLYSCLKEYWDLQGGVADSIVSCIFFGEFVGALAAGPLADAYGRKPVSMAGVWTIAIAGFSSAFSGNVVTFLVLRAICGVGIGASAVPFDLAAEVMPKSWRGRVLVLFELWWCLGSFATVFLAWIILQTDSGWRTLILACSVPCFIAGTLMMWLPESPRWLLSEGRVSEAEEVIKFICTTNGMPVPALDLKQAPHPSSQSHDGATTPRGASVSKAGRCGNIRGLCYPQRNLQTTTALVTLWACMGFSFYGISLLLMRVSNVDAVDCKFDYGFLFETYSTEVVGTLALLLVIEWLGRLKSAAASYSVAGLAVTMLGVCGSQGWTTAETWAGCTALAASMAAGSATWVLTPEQYETNIRSTGHAAANAMSRVGAFAASYWVNSSVSDVGVGALIGFSCLIAAATTCALSDASKSALS